MQPSKIIPLPSLPLNVSGKIDHTAIRNTLGSLLRGMGEVKAAVSAKTLRRSHQRLLNAGIKPKVSDIESSIAKIWQHEIGLTSAPNWDTNFFDLGGHR